MDQSSYQYYLSHYKKYQSLKQRPHRNNVPATKAVQYKSHPAPTSQLLTFIPLNFPLPLSTPACSNFTLLLPTPPTLKLLLNRTPDCPPGFFVCFLNFFLATITGTDDFVTR